MDILSTGQKIKRARIYKGITLKELCGDKISISKMSCIENGKIKADLETIDYISKIINVDYEYLVEDIYDQILLNLIDIKEKNYDKDEFENKIDENLSYALEYEYFQLAFELLHVMFTYYIEEEQYDNIQKIIPKYYTVYQKSVSDDNTFTYFLDMAQYFFHIEKYYDALAYYSRIRELEKIEYTRDTMYLNIKYYEAKCYYELKNYGETYELLKRIMEIPNLDKEDFIYGRVLSLYAIVCIRFGYKDSEKFIADSNKCLKKNPAEIALSKKEYGTAYFSISDSKRGVDEITEAISLFPKDNIMKYVEFLNNCTRVYYDYEEFDKAHELSEINLNLAIESQDIRLIEKSYFLKGMILEKLNRLKEAETYMNLSLDSLMKFGCKEKRLRRYVDMANLYYKLDNIQESIKYFSFAINLDKMI